MAEAGGASITAAVEGDLDVALLRRITGHLGLSLGKVYGRQGKPQLLRALAGYNAAARFAPWIVLVDLDRDGDCAPSRLERWLPQPAPKLCFRIAVRAAEAWPLADRERLAAWLGVAESRVPAQPDRLDDPKREAVNLARRTRRRGLRGDLVPREASGRAVGPLYTARMIEFIDSASAGWRPDQASRASDSLARCIRCLRRLGEADDPSRQTRAPA